MVEFLRRLFWWDKEEWKKRRKAVRSLEEHQEIKQIAQKLLQFLKKHANEMPWGRIVPDWPEQISIDWNSKYFGHYQTKTKRIELKLDARHYNYQLMIRHQDIVDGQMRPMIIQTINAEHVEFNNEGKIKKDKELKQIFEEVFATVISVYRKQVKAREKQSLKAQKKRLAERKEIDKKIRRRILKALNNKVSV